MTTQKVLDEQQFLDIAAALRQRIVGDAELKGEGKRFTLTVLDGLISSVKVHGARQHGLTKKMLMVAMTVFKKMFDDPANTDEEKAVLDSLLVMVLHGIKAR